MIQIARYFFHIFSIFYFSPIFKHILRLAILINYLAQRLILFLRLQVINFKFDQIFIDFRIIILPFNQSAEFLQLLGKLHLLPFIFLNLIKQRLLVFFLFLFPARSHQELNLRSPWRSKYLRFVVLIHLIIILNLLWPRNTPQKPIFSLLRDCFSHRFLISFKVFIFDVRPYLLCFNLSFVHFGF